MEYLLIMSFSGSTMTGIYLLLRYLLKDKISARFYYLLAKAAVLYYLVPLPFLKRWYRAVLQYITPERQMKVTQIPMVWTNRIIYTDGKMYVNGYAKVQTVAVSIWLLGAGFLLLVRLFDYLRTVRRFKSCAKSEMTDPQRAVLDELRRQYGLRRSIALYQGQAQGRTMTFGFFRPVIVCDRELGSREAELLVRHEMIHIRRLDTLWKVLAEFVTFLHWWNPVMWILYRDFERVCEWSCDETVMQDRPGEEVKAYLRLLIEEAQKGKSERASLRWRVGFGDSAKRLKERMENLMKRRKWNRLVAGMLVMTLMFANSMTVFAYRDVIHETASEDTPQESVEEMLHSDSFGFVPEETQEFVAPDKMEFRYERQFTDEAGNIYPIPEEGSASVQWGCSHTYVWGTASYHIPNADGGCKVLEYRAERCSLCSSVILHELINEITYKVCPHNP